MGGRISLDQIADVKGHTPPGGGGFDGILGDTACRPAMWTLHASSTACVLRRGGALS